MTEATTHRIVVVHGAPGTELVRILEKSGLEPVVDDGDVTVWGPAASSALQDLLPEHPHLPTGCHVPAGCQGNGQTTRAHTWLVHADNNDLGNGRDLWSDQ